MSTRGRSRAPRASPAPSATPRASAAEELTFAGAGGTEVNGYLARPAARRAAAPG